MFPFSSFLTYVVVTSFTPGLNNIMALSTGARHGWRSGLPYLAGLLLAQWCMICAGIFAFRYLNALLPQLVPAMRVVGAVYILYLAWKILRSGTELETGEVHSGVGRGIAMQFINPKLYLYIFTTAQSYILPYFAERSGMLLLLGTGMTLCCGCSFFCWLIGGGFFRRLFSRCGQLVNTVMALLLACCAVSLFL